MNFQDGPSTSFNTQKSILSDSKLLDILENGTLKVQKNSKKRYTSMYKRCKYCYSKGIRKDTIYFCAECQDQPGLCLEGCFQDFHKQT